MSANEIAEIATPVPARVIFFFLCSEPKYPLWVVYYPFAERYTLDDIQSICFGNRFRLGAILRKPPDYGIYSTSVHASSVLAAV